MVLLLTLSMSATSFIEKTLHDSLCFKSSFWSIISIMYSKDESFYSEDFMKVLSSILSIALEFLFETIFHFIIVFCTWNLKDFKYTTGGI